ncbi:MAG: acetate--CoA ligase family protein [Burkholderiales bacterium]|nr:acetate--CoA ligase family protein [Burkholderiales bacterium]
MLMIEHAGKALLRSHGVAVPHGQLVRETADIEQWRGPYPAALKAQVSSGGRGKAGGVARVETPDEARAAALRLFDSEFQGERPSALLIEPWLGHERELYLSIVVDGGYGGYAVLYSPNGGVDIEAQQPSVYEVGPAHNFRAHALRALLSRAERDTALVERIVAMARRLLRVATVSDALTVEINPLAVIDGKLLALDAKIARDEAAAFRHADIAQECAHRRTHEAARVARALDNNLMMVALEGEIGLISGGAGMTMAVMDMIAAAGMRPACFLDCSSNPTPAGYRLAFALLDEDPAIKAILVSIFGGGTHIDRVARTMSEIMRERRCAKPVVFRMNGNGRDAADAIMTQAGLCNHQRLEDAVAAVHALGTRA